MQEEKKMDGKRTFSLSLMGLLVLLFLSLALFGCDSGEKVVDEVTGNRAVKQYHQSKKDLSKIADQQEERLKDIQEQEQDPDEKGQ